MISSLTFSTGGFTENSSWTIGIDATQVDPMYLSDREGFDDWTDGNYSFDSLEKTIGYIKNTNKDDLLALVNTMFLEGQYMNTTIQIRGDDFKDTPFFNW